MRCSVSTDRKRISGLIPKTSSGFTVHMPGLDLATLIQMACAQRVRQAVRVQCHERVGFLFFHDGQLVHAVASGLEGEAAVVHMLSWRGGDMRSCDEPFPERASIHCSVDSLLIRIAQGRDEAGRDAPSEASPSHLRRKPVPSPPLRLLPGEPRGRSTADQSGVLASVRLNANGEIVAQNGEHDLLPALVAYVTCVGALVGSHLGLAPFEALHAEVGNRRVLVFADGTEMVGLSLQPGPVLDEQLRQLGV